MRRVMIFLVGFVVGVCGTTLAIGVTILPGGTRLGTMPLSERLVVGAAERLGVTERGKVTVWQECRAYLQEVQLAADANFLEDIFWVAAQRSWTVITFNHAHFAMLHRAWLLWGVPHQHAGVLVFELPTNRRLDEHEMAAAVQALLQSQPMLTNSAYEWADGRGWTAL